MTKFQDIVTQLRRVKSGVLDGFAGGAKEEFSPQGMSIVFFDDKGEAVAAARFEPEADEPVEEYASDAILKLIGAGPDALAPVEPMTGLVRLECRDPNPWMPFSTRGGDTLSGSGAGYGDVFVDEAAGLKRMAELRERYPRIEFRLVPVSDGG